MKNRGLNYFLIFSVSSLFLVLILTVCTYFFTYGGSVGIDSDSSQFKASMMIEEYKKQELPKKFENLAINNKYELLKEQFELFKQKANELSD